MTMKCTIFLQVSKFKRSHSPFANLLSPSSTLDTSSTIFYDKIASYKKYPVLATYLCGDGSGLRSDLQ